MLSAPSTAKPASRPNDNSDFAGPKLVASAHAADIFGAARCASLARARGSAEPDAIRPVTRRKRTKVSSESASRSTSGMPLPCVGHRCSMSASTLPAGQWLGARPSCVDRSSRAVSSTSVSQTRLRWPAHLAAWRRSSSFSDTRRSCHDDASREVRTNRPGGASLEIALVAGLPRLSL